MNTPCQDNKLHKVEVL